MNPENRPDQEPTREEKIAAFRNRKQKDRVRRIPKIIFRSIGILLAVCLLLTVWVNRKFLFSGEFSETVQLLLAEMSGGDGFPYSIKGDSVMPSNFFVSGKELVLASDRSLNMVTAKGHTVIETQHSYSTPVLRASGSRCLLYHLGGLDYQVESVSGTVQKTTAEQKIIAGDLAANGRYVLVTQADNYASALYAYLPDGTLQYQYLFSNCYVTSVALRPDGAGGIACGMFSKNGALYSAIYVFDFNTEEPLAVLEQADVCYLDVSYGEHGTAVCVGDTMLSVVDTANYQKNDYAYGQETLQAWSVYDGTAALALSAYSGASESHVRIIGADAAEVVSMPVSGEVRDVALYGDTVCVLHDGVLDAYLVGNGAAVASRDVGKDARAVAMRDTRSAYLLGVTEVRYVSF